MYILPTIFLRHLTFLQSLLSPTPLFRFEEISPKKSKKRKIDSFLLLLMIYRTHSLRLPISSYQHTPSYPVGERTLEAPPGKFGPWPKALGVEGPRRSWQVAASCNLRRPTRL
ncbi:hypothetical protein NPIL_452281 [Nephila pilipes]|uniref:Uncharacterized protein n=1 Tax=Nephila pilipes TaxID=299642 RepID=A0A8X6I9U8_NEPPI|nr:hypothetical protein NPIL_452281 [Nephila pilipes]